MSDQTQVQVDPYLIFAGNCREAMAFYKEVLRGELEIMPFAGSPVEVPEDYQQKVMHSTLRFGGAAIMASDQMPGQPVEHSDGMHISLGLKDPAEAERIFEELSAGGRVTLPFEEPFWGGKFGSCIDRFGVSWMVSCEG